MLERLIDELFEKEFTLLELDNKVQEITSSKDSIFDYGNKDCLHYENLSYYVDEIEDYINVEWETIKASNEPHFETLVKIKEVY